MDRINWVTSDAFNAISQLQHVGQANPEQVHQRMRSAIEDLLNRAGQAGFGRDDASAIAYAAVALADEVAMLSDGALRDYWQRAPLQMHFFRGNVAGERFYTVLEDLRRDPSKVDILRAYYIALALGFQGRYRVSGGDVAIADLLESLRRDLQATIELPDRLSPHGLRPSEASLRMRGEFPFVWVTTGLSALALVAYAGFHATLNDGVRTVLDVVSSVAAQ